MIINAGIKRIVYKYPYPDEFSKALLDEANIITDKDNELLEKFNSYYIAT